MQFTVSVNTESSSNLYTIISKLNQLEKDYDILAMDFEGCSRYSDKEKEEMKQYLKEHPEISKEEKRQIVQFIESDGLSHPSLTYITHLSVAWSETDSFVAILDTEHKRKMIFKWLVKTSIKQLWHNLSFDGKHILYHTGKLPQNYEDTEVLSKTLLNHVNTFKAKSGLKVLMSYKYGEDWAVSKDIFKIEELYNPELITYAGKDSCATYALWNEIQESLKD